MIGRRADICLDDPRRRLVRNFERRIDVSESMIRVAIPDMLQLFLPIPTPRI